MTAISVGESGFCLTLCRNGEGGATPAAGRMFGIGVCDAGELALSTSALWTHGDWLVAGLERDAGLLRQLTAIGFAHRGLALVQGLQGFGPLR